MFSAVSPNARVPAKHPLRPICAMSTDMRAGAACAYRYFREDRATYAHPAAARRSQREPYERADPEVGRNDRCPCGSGRKYKRHCGSADIGGETVH